MANLYTGNEVRVTEDYIYHLALGSKIYMNNLKGQNHLGIDPPYKDYAMLVVVMVAGVFCLVKSWMIVGFILLAFGGVAFWAAYTTKRHTHAISLFPYNGEMIILYFYNESEALEAYEVIARQIARLKLQREQGED
jgi:hypothetical protein